MDTPQEKEDQKQALKWNLFVLGMWGYWVPETDNQRKFLRYRIYAVFILGLTFIPYIILEIICLLTSKNIEEIANSSWVLFTHLMQFTKLCCLHSKRSSIIKIMNNLNQEAFKPQTRRQQVLLQKQVHRGKLSFVLFLILVVVTVSFWYIFPLVETTGEMDLPMKVWFPFDIHRFPLFQIVYVYQFIIIMVTAINDLSMVTMISIFMANVCGQLDILNDKFRGLGKAENDEDGREQCVCEILEHKTRRAFVDCVKHHFKIIE